MTSSYVTYWLTGEEITEIQTGSNNREHHQLLPRHVLLLPAQRTLRTRQLVIATLTV